MAGGDTAGQGPGHNVKANDAPTLLSAAALLMTVAVLAAVVPALRASRVDPVVALRNE